MLAKIVFVLLSVLVMVAASALAQEEHDHDDHGHDDEMASALAEEDHHDHDHHGHDDETKKGCANNELCKKAFQTVLMAHDICEEEQMPVSLEVGLHMFEDTCEHGLCNSVSEPFDPMVANCDHDDHDHDHDHDHERCGCIAKEFGFVIDCNKTEVIQAAADYLQDENCILESKNNKTPECIRNFYIFQAHHDFCAHDDLPPFNEIIFHAMEEHFDTCFIERQYNPKLSMCPPVNCEDKEALKKAVDEMYEHCEAPANVTDLKEADLTNDNDGV